jgi:hypothetical protein
VTRAWQLSSRWLPQGWVDALRQLALFAGAYYAYRLVRGFVDGHVTVAFDNARTLVDVERSLNTFFEADLQHWLLTHAGWAVDAANWAYVNSHFSITVTFLIWLYLARNEAFYFVRNMFMIAMALALVGYMLYPTAPPRLLPEWGFTDTVENFVGTAGANSAEALYNPFAAVPSMHVAFALMIGVTAVQLVRNPVAKAWWSLYPVLVTFVVVVTANHFWVDAALGAMVAGMSAYAAQAGLARARPEAWAWRPALGAKAA